MYLSTEKSATMLIEKSPTREQKNIIFAAKLWFPLNETNYHSY